MGIERRPANAGRRLDWLDCYGAMPFWTGCQLPSGNRMDGTGFYPHEIASSAKPALCCVHRTQSRKRPGLRQLKFNEKACFAKLVVANSDASGYAQ